MGGSNHETEGWGWELEMERPRQQPNGEGTEPHTEHGPYSTFLGFHMIIITATQYSRLFLSSRSEEVSICYMLQRPSVAWSLGTCTLRTPRWSQNASPGTTSSFLLHGALPSSQSVTLTIFVIRS